MNNVFFKPWIGTDFENGGIKNHIISLLLTAIAMIGFISCSESEHAIRKFSDGEIMPGRIDLSNAVSIAMGRSQTKSRAIDGEYLSSSMYKIDEHGRISAVAVYFFTDKYGNRLEHEEKLRLCPTYLHKLTDNYVVAVHCKYYDKDGDEVKDQWIEMDVNEDGGYWIEQDVSYKNLLIRLSDGKIWCVDMIAENILNLSYGDINGSTGKSVRGTFAEDNHGVLYHNVGESTLNIYRFNLTGLTPSYEQIAIADAEYIRSWYITDNGVVWGWNDRGSYPTHYEICPISFAWPKSGYQIFGDDEIEDNIKNNVLSIPDLTVSSSNYRYPYSDILIEPSYRPIYKSWILSYKNNPIVILSTEYKITGIENGEREWINMSALKERSPEDYNTIRSYVSQNCPLVSCYEILVGDTQGSVFANTPIELKDVPENFIRDAFCFEISNVYQMGDRIVISQENYESTNLWELDLVKKEWHWLKKLDISLSDYEYSYNNKVYRLKYDSIREGIYWYDPFANEGGLLKYENLVPDYMDIYMYSDINRGFLRFVGRNPANGNEEEMVIDIETGKIRNQSSQAIEWNFQTIISLN